MLGPTTRADVHLPTVLAIGVVSFAAVTVLHEAGGHGLSCLLVGGQGAGLLQHRTALRRPGGWGPPGCDRRRQHRQHRGRAGRHGRRDRPGPGPWRLVVRAVAVWGDQPVPRRQLPADWAADRLWRLVVCGPCLGAGAGLDRWDHRAGLLGERGWQPPGQAAGVAAPGRHPGAGARGPDAVADPAAVGGGAGSEPGRGAAEPPAATLCPGDLVDRAVGAAVAGAPAYLAGERPARPGGPDCQLGLGGGRGGCRPGLRVAPGPGLGSFAGYSIAR